jgi:alkylation response protein AidB-like acyl-CoA dehydrogenase
VFFDYSAEQQDFRASLRRLIADRAPLSAVRARLGDAHDPELWRYLCQDMALAALAVPERYGGAGFSLEETAIAVAELGRTLAPVPFLEAALAIEAVLRLGAEEQRQRLLPDLVSGQRLAIVAGWGAGEDGAVQADRTGDGFALTGSRPHVLRGHVADQFLVPAAGSDGALGLYLVDAAAPGVTVRGRERSFDLTRPVSALSLNAAAGTPLGDGSAAADGAGNDWAGLFDIGRTLLAAEMTAVAQACLDMSVEYAKRRVQFNRAIGSFQAIKHGCAEMAVEIDAAQAAADWAVMLAAAGDRAADHGGLGAAALIAKAQAADTLAAAAGWNIQVHGGIGFTWEHDAHLFLRRAKTDQVLFGDSGSQRAALADLVGI